MNRTVPAAALAAALVVGCATTREASQGYVHEYYVDQIAPLAEDGSAAVSFRAGPVEFVELRVRNRPTPGDVAGDTRKTDISHPKPAITAVNHGAALAMVTLESVLEDGRGTPLLRCGDRRPQELFAGTKDDWNTCFMEGIPTRDWSRVSHFRVRATVRVREDRPVTAALPAGAAGEPLSTAFVGPESTAEGAQVLVTRYAERQDDVAHAGTEFRDGVVTVRGQVGIGNGSRYGGLGPWWNLRGDGQPVDASRFRTVTFRLASSAAQLRLQLVGPDSLVRNSGCYPVTSVRVNEKLQEYTVDLSRFAPEGFCGSKGRSARETLPRLVAVEVASTTVSNRPVWISVGPTIFGP